MYSIGDVAKLGGLSVRMLRHYDEIGLLRPARVDAATGYRWYGDDEVERLRRILLFRELGFSLAQTGELVAEDLPPEQLRGMLRLRRSQLGDELTAAAARLRRLERLIASLDHPETAMTATVSTTALPAVTVVMVSSHAATFGPADIGPALQPLYPLLFEQLAAAGLTASGAPLALYDDLGDDGIDVHAAIAIAVDGSVDPAVAVDGLTVRTLEAVELAATIVHHGSMEECDASYAALLGWISDHGYRTLGPSREVYLACPDDVSAWVTELQFPIAPVTA